MFKNDFDMLVYPRVMQALLQINRDALFAKLNAVAVDKTCVPCSAFIEIVSKAPATDKRIISDYPADLVILYNRRRHFTPAGLLRYTHDGHLINYGNVCEWLGIIPDPDLEYKKELKKMLRGTLYIKQSLVKFVFGRIRALRLVPPLCTLAEFLDAIPIAMIPDADKDKLAFLRRRF